MDNTLLLNPFKHLNKMYRNRIDILKRIGRDNAGSHVDPDPEKYRVLPHDQIVTRERLRQGLHVGRNYWLEGEDGKLYVNGELAQGE